MAENNNLGGCMYKENTDTICKYLSEVVTDRDNTMKQQFHDQNKTIRDYNRQIIELLTAQGELMREVRLDVRENVKPAIEDLRTKDWDKEHRLKNLEGMLGWKWKVASILTTVVISIFILIQFFKHIIPK